MLVSSLRATCDMHASSWQPYVELGKGGQVPELLEALFLLYTNFRQMRADRLLNMRRSSISPYTG